MIGDLRMGVRFGQPKVGGDSEQGPDAELAADLLERLLGGRE